MQVELADGRGSHVLWSETIVDSELAALQPDSHLVQALVGGITQAVLAHAKTVDHVLTDEEILSVVQRSR